jgi:hypothetical protein
MGLQDPDPAPSINIKITEKTHDCNCYVTSLKHDVNVSTVSNKPKKPEKPYFLMAS